MNQSRRTKVVIYVQQSNNCVELLRFIYRNIEGLRKRILIVFEIINKKNAHEYAARGIQKLPMIEYSNGRTAAGLNDVITTLMNLHSGDKQFGGTSGNMSGRGPRIPNSNDEYLYSQIFEGVKRGADGFTIEKEEDDNDNDEGFSQINIQKKMAEYSYALPGQSTRGNRRQSGGEYNLAPDNIQDDDGEIDQDTQIQNRMREFEQDRQAKINIDQFKQSQRQGREGRDGRGNNTARPPIIDEKIETDFLLSRTETTREPTLYDVMQIKPKESGRGPKSDTELILSMLDENNYTQMDE